MTEKYSDGKNARILLATIASAHGIKGEVALRTFTADPEDVAAYGPLSDAAGTRTFKIKSLKVTPKTVIARLDGVADRNAAEALRGTDLYVARGRLPKAGDKEYYHADLAGLRARDPEGSDMGVVIAVANFGAGDLLEVRVSDSKHTEYVPFTDANVPEVNLAEGYAVIVMPQMTGEPEPASSEDEPDEHAEPED